MKDRIIETAGRSWRLLGQKGEISVADLAKLLNEKNEVAYQALGWLAREDKVSYSDKNGKTFVSLIESEIQAFQGVPTGNGGAEQQQSKRKIAKAAKA